MTATMSMLRAAPIVQPEPRPAHRVIVSFADAPFQVETERGASTLDAISALVVGTNQTDALVEQFPAASNPLVVDIPAVKCGWMPKPAALAVSHGRPICAPVLLSAASLLLAHRLRQRTSAQHAARDDAGETGRLASDFAATFRRAVLEASIDAPTFALQRETLARRRALVDRARRRLAESPAAPHPFPELANALGVSASHFARGFRAETGLSVHQYVLRLRMAGALRRLSCGAADLSRLALELGFSSHSHFTATFRREFGMSPARVRHLLGGEGPAAKARAIPGADCSRRSASFTFIAHRILPQGASAPLVIDLDGYFSEL